MSPHDEARMSMFCHLLDEIRDKCHQNSIAHGFWDEQPMRMTADGCMGTEDVTVNRKPWSFGEKIALIHSELSEMFEAWRKNLSVSEKEIILFDSTKQSTNPCDPIVTRRITAIEEEVADVFIRLLDLCGKLNIDVGSVILAKMQYNESRPMMHGGRKC